MSSQQYNSGPTTNDLLESRIAENILAALRDSAGAQVPEDVPNLDNAPNNKSLSIMKGS
jgi:hypothetical protein